MPALKFVDGSSDVIEGLGAPFGGPLGNNADLDAERFTKSTDFCLPWYSDRPLIYEHGLSKPGVQVVGRVKSWELKDDQGLWVQAQLDVHSKYYESIKKLIAKDALGFSSGAMAHLVKTAPNGNIERWPWVELSLTPSPCNPYARVELQTAKAHYKSAGLDAAVLDSAPLEQELVAQLPAETKAATGMADAPDDTEDDPEGSYEDLMDDLQDALNPKTPWAMSGYTAIVATFPTHVIVCRYDYDGDCTYWDIPYTYEGDVITLGTAVEVEQTYTPAKSAPDCNLALDATSLSRHAAALTLRTEDVRERRVKAGRALSTANRTALEAAAKQCDSAAAAIRDLLSTTDQMTQEAAKAAYLASPEALALEVELLQLACDSYFPVAV